MKMKTTLTVTGFAGIIFVLAACSESNDLIGTWELDREALQQELKGTMFAGSLQKLLESQPSTSDTIEFTENRMISGQNSTKVDYEVLEDGRVEIYQIQNGERQGQALVLDPTDGRIGFPVPMVGEISYVKQ